MWLRRIFPDSMTIWTAIGAVATFFAVIIALYGEKIKTRIWGAKIQVSHENSLPFNKTAVFKDEKGNQKNGFYIRLKIENIGKSTVHGVYGKLTKIKYAQDKKLLDTYDPSVLRWVGTQQCKPQNLSPKDYDFLDVLFTIENNENFIIQTEYVLRGSPFIFKKNLGPHILYISIYSDDATTISKKYQLSFESDFGFNSAKLIEV